MLALSPANSYSVPMSAADLKRQNGAAIRALRRKDGMSIADLAEAAGFEHPQTLVNIENEHRQVSWHAMSRIARALCVPVAAISRVDVPDDDTTSKRPKAA